MLFSRKLSDKLADLADSPSSGIPLSSDTTLAALECARDFKTETERDADATSKELRRDLSASRGDETPEETGSCSGDGARCARPLLCPSISVDALLPTRGLIS